MREWSAVILWVVLCAPSFADVTIVEQIVAKVNGDIITRSELERTRQALEADLRQQRKPPEEINQTLKEREGEFLKDQIDNLLLAQKGKELTISVDSEVTQQIADIQRRSKISDPDKFQQYVRQETGMTFEDFKAQMKNQILTRRVIQQEVGGRITVPKPELQKYYEEHKTEFVRQEQVFLREIFLLTEGKTPDQAAAIEKKAKDLVARTRKGEKFPELARDNSDSETAQNYGELGWWKKGELDPRIEALVFKERRGYVTDPIKTDKGFEIIKLEERHEAGQAPFEDVEQEVTERIYMNRMQPRVREYLTKLRQEAFLEIREGFVDAGAAPGKDTRWKDPAQLKPETTTKAEVEARRKRRLLWLIPLPGGGSNAAPSSTEPAKPAAPAPTPAPGTLPPK